MKILIKQVAEIVSTTDEAETTSVDGGESVDVDKDKAEYQEHKNVIESVMEEYNKGGANETQMAKSHQVIIDSMPRMVSY